MPKLLIDKSKLLTIKNHSLKEKITVPTVYNWVRSGKLMSEIIDGVTFIVQEPTFIKPLSPLELDIKNEIISTGANGSDDRLLAHIIRNLNKIVLKHNP